VARKAEDAVSQIYLLYALGRLTFVRATTTMRVSSTQKRWISLSRWESGGWP
jgi:hypothetical protein